MSQPSARAARATATERAWLDVPFGEKDAAKALGARWDPSARRWYDPRPVTAGLQRWAALPDVPDLLPGGGPDLRLGPVRGPHPFHLLVHQRPDLRLTARLGASPPDDHPPGGFRLRGLWRG